jgi:hypothetical protein
VAGGGILLSLACALRALGTRDYSLAPEPGDLARLSAAPADWIRWRLIGNMLGQGLLLVMLAPVGGYFLYALLRGAA